MKLTKAEQAICDKYAAKDDSGRVRCFVCPLRISNDDLLCYATIDGRTKEAKTLKRIGLKNKPFAIDSRNEEKGEMETKIYTIRQFAEYVGWPEHAIRSLVDNGTIPSFCQGTRRYIGEKKGLEVVHALAKGEKIASKVKMKIKLDEGAIMPTRAHATDAGLDLYSREDKTIFSRRDMMPGPDGREIALPIGEAFDTGVHVELPPGYYGKIESKSGLNVKHGIVSCGGVIDEGYTGSIVVKLYNLSPEPYIVHEGDKIAQLVIMPYFVPELKVVEELAETERGDDGFGSSGR